MSVAVLGSGAFGTALAISLARRGETWLWTRSDAQAGTMRALGENTERLPGIRVPETVRITTEIESVRGVQTIIVAVPMQRLRGFLQHNAPALFGHILIAACKGAELNSGLGPVGIIRATMPDAVPALLTGPSFARDIAQGLPTALTLACGDADTAKALQQTLVSDNLRLYRTTDTIGAELGGALKNVIAIACGAVIGARLGESARAALMTRGYAEMQRYALLQGARAETLAGLSGFGDLALTCTSPQSRNYRLGLSIGTGDRFDKSITVEGAATARAIAKRAADLRIEMPITRAVVDLLDKKRTLSETMADLLARPLKEE